LQMQKREEKRGEGKGRKRGGKERKRLTNLITK
jgi:hypothetical protein